MNIEDVEDGAVMDECSFVEHVKEDFDESPDQLRHWAYRACTSGILHVLISMDGYQVYLFDGCGGLTEAPTRYVVDFDEEEEAQVVSYSGPLVINLPKDAKDGTKITIANKSEKDIRIQELVEKIAKGGDAAKKASEAIRKLTKANGVLLRKLNP